MTRKESALAHVIAFGSPARPSARVARARFGRDQRAHVHPEKTASYESMGEAGRASRDEGRRPDGVPGGAVADRAAPDPEELEQSRQDAALAGTERPTTKPDADNVAKAIADACNGVVWVDDAQVVELSSASATAQRPA